jgi:hypothetical protein
MNHAIKAIAHEIKIRRVAYFYSAAERRSRGALWPSFAPALIRGARAAALPYLARAFMVCSLCLPVEMFQLSWLSLYI